MMKTFLGVRWGATYIFAPQCPNLGTLGHVYASGGGNHAEDNMAAQCGLPNEFYLTSAPCPDCAMMLYNAYKVKNYWPLIHIARPYQGKGKEGSEGNKKVNLHCLAMLMNAGFMIVPWDWITFENDYITNDDCKNAIKEMVSDSHSYSERYSKALKAIHDAKKMTGNHHEICSNAAKNGK